MELENYNSEILLPRHYKPNVGVLEDRVSGNNPLINRDPIIRQMPISSVPSKTFIMICLPMRKQSPQIQTCLQGQDLYQICEMYYII